MSATFNRIRSAWRDLRTRTYSRPTLTGRNHSIASRLLLDVAELCESRGIDYTLDSGTLLGIAREGDLIPWDHDLDILIPVASLKRFQAAVPELVSKGWRFSGQKFMQSDDVAWKKGAVRLIILRNHRFPLLRMGRGRIALDVLVFYPHGDHVWWAMLGRVCRLPAHHFASHGRLPFHGYPLRVPNDHEALLEHKYGSGWRAPDRNFQPGTQDGTILRHVRCPLATPTVDAPDR